MSAFRWNSLAYFVCCPWLLLCLQQQLSNWGQIVWATVCKMLSLWPLQMNACQLPRECRGTADWLCLGSSHPISECKFKALLLCLCSSFLPMCLERQQMMVQEIGFLQHMWETQMEFLVPDFSLLHSGLLGSLISKPAVRSTFPLCLSLTWFLPFSPSSLLHPSISASL